MVQNFSMEDAEQNFLSSIEIYVFMIKGTMPSDIKTITTMYWISSDI